MDRNYDLMYLDSERLLGVAGRITNLTLRFFDNYDSYTITKFGGNILSSIDWIDSTHFICDYQPYLYELKDTYIIKNPAIAAVTGYSLSYDKKQLLGYKGNDIVLINDINDTSNYKVLFRYQKIELNKEE